MTTTKTIVVDWPTSSRLMFIGFAGEASPFYSLPTSAFIADAARREKDKELNWTELYLEISRIFYKIFFNFLQVKPRQWRVLIVEGLFLRREIRDCIYSVLFHDFQASEVSFQPNIAMVALASGSSAGLIVDIDRQESIVVGYSHQRILTSSLRSSAGSDSCFQEVKRILCEKGSSQSLLDRHEEAVEAIVKFVFSCLSTDKLSSSNNQDFIDESIWTKLGFTSSPFPSFDLEDFKRCRAAILFGSSPKDNFIYSDKGLYECIVEAVSATHVEDRTRVLKNLIVSGATSTSLGDARNWVLQGLQQFSDELSNSESRLRIEADRVLSELKLLEGNSKFTAEHLAWIGGSLFSCMERNNASFIPYTSIKAQLEKTKYDVRKKATILAPEWMSIGYERTEF